MSRARARAGVHRARASRLRLTAALAVTLAATTAATVAGPGVAAAAPAALTQEAGAEATVPLIEATERVDGAGATGFLTNGWIDHWVRYDGTSVELPSISGDYRGTPGSDLVVGNNGSHYTVHDMAKGGDPLRIEGNYWLWAVNGSTLVTVDSYTKQLRLVGRASDGRTVTREVTGLPYGQPEGVSSTTPGTIAVHLGGTSGIKLVDVATAAVVESYDADSDASLIQVTPGHVSWVSDGRTTVVDRKTGETRELPYPGRLVLGDEWLAVKEGSRLTLRSRTDGRTVEPFLYPGDMAIGLDGTLVVRGSTTTVHDAVFRVALGADGAPAVTVVADFPEPPPLALRSVTVPSRITTSWARFSWEFNREADADFWVTHKATGRTELLRDNMNPFVDWDTTVGRLFGAYNGEYTWKLSAGSIERTGTFTLARPTQARDFNDNGGADALVRDGAGNLSAYGIGQIVGMKDRECYEEGCPPVVHKPDAERLGTGGWNTYTLMAAPGNLAGGAADDIVGRDRDGVLWLHQSEKQKLLPRTKIGGGWQVYNKITGGSDLNGDGRGDLLATDASGVLWFYASTGDARAPFKARKRVGGGWQAYDLLAAPGNVAGASGGDLLARDRDGVLWLYLGKGDGTFTARRKIGGGWQKYTRIIAGGKSPWHPVTDLYAIGPSGSAHYRGTNSTTRPFDAADVLPLRTDSTTYKTVF
ncbi:hypothetical protein [Streptomyces roseolus]|uniref:hypothetical protein n=1 Tax=Streptomyces roseolus TaxID=67358 RepID=UPI00167928A6|nr:hypothetical protein [Streptomyces roseolus]GGR65591.1 hypothetical protein GCM10010282_68270 [Streptomyces roseolus]